MNTAISATANAGAATAAGASGKTGIGKDATEDRFLKLLIAQMKNQDPLNPLDNAAVTSQMAQINTVQGISQLNATMASMLTQMQGTQAMSLPGHQVLIEGNSLSLAKSGASSAARAGYELAADADRVTVEIKNAQGQLVNTLELGKQAAGANTFNWNGSTGSTTAPDGAYSFTVKASAGGGGVTVGSLMAAQVVGTANTPQGVRLTLDGVGTRSYSDVRMVL